MGKSRNPKRVGNNKEKKHCRASIIDELKSQVGR